MGRSNDALTKGEDPTPLLELTVDGLLTRAVDARAMRSR